MTMAGRPNRFPNFAMSGSSADKPTQPIGSSFGNPRWQNNDIWGNKIIGSSLGANRDATGSRGSDETSPTGPSGSAQLNPSSEAVPWSSQGIWNSTSSHKPSASGSASPTRLRDVHEMANSSQFFPRSSLGQNGSAFPARSKPAGNMDAAASAKYTAYGDAVADAPEPSSLYGSIGVNLGRRNSSDSAFTGFAPNRQGSISSRQPEIDSNLAAARLGDYGFGQNTSNHGAYQNQRPSVPNHSISFPAEGSSHSRVPAGFGSEVPDEKLSDAFHRVLSLEDTSKPVINGYTTNGLPHQTSQPFQFNPGSSAWSQEPLNPSKGYELPTNFADPSSGVYYHHPKKASVGGSPAGNMYRSHLNSPRPFGNMPNPRAEPWNKPSVRDVRALHEIDRQPHASSQYLPQQATPYYPAQYYSPDVPQFPNPYDQGSHFRSSAQVYPYVPAAVHVPIRPSKDQDPGKGVRSMLLEDFRGAGKSKRYELKDIYGHVVEFSGDQHGSRFIQEKLQTANSDEKEQVFREIEPNAIPLMKDVFGNYVIQKFFEHGNQVQKKILATMMKGQVAELSTQMYACRVVQKALEHVLVEQQAEIVDELKQKIMQVVRDANGNHVVQKVIQMFPRQCVPSIMDAFRGQVEQLAAHNYGCRVIQRILEHGTEEEKRVLMEEIQAHANFLITDQFGNYVAQHIISQGDAEDRAKIINLVVQNVVTLSKHKFASNVVEKCIQHGTVAQRKLIQVQLTTANSDGSSPLPLIIKDQFGNYVVQKMLNFLKGEAWEAFVKEVTVQCAQIKKWGGGGAKQIIAIDRLITEISQANAANAANTMPTVTTTDPSSPHVPGDAASTAPTPSLTTEQSSPQSSSPPSTDADNVEDTASEATKPSLHTDSAPVTQVNGE